MQILDGSTAGRHHSTHPCIDNDVLSTKEEGRLGRVGRVGDFLDEQRVVTPVEMALDIVCDTDFGGHKVVEQQLECLARLAVAKVVAHVWAVVSQSLTSAGKSAQLTSFPQAEHHWVHESVALRKLGRVLEHPAVVDTSVRVAHHGDATAKVGVVEAVSDTRFLDG